MPKKILAAAAVPSLIEERLKAWGASIRTQRVQQKLRAADLAQRMDISDATLRRLERGDPGAGAALYLVAFQILGMMEELAPMPAASLLTTGASRVRLPGKDLVHEYF